MLYCVLNIGLFQYFCHSCFHAFYTTIGQSYMPTTLSLENVFIYLFHKFFLPAGVAAGSGVGSAAGGGGRSGASGVVG